MFFIRNRVENRNRRREGQCAPVNEAFASAGDHFGSRCKDVARRLKEDAMPVKRAMWSSRDLRKGIVWIERIRFSSPPGHSNQSGSFRKG